MITPESIALAAAKPDNANDLFNMPLLTDTAAADPVMPSIIDSEPVAEDVDVPPAYIEPAPDNVPVADATACSDPAMPLLIETAPVSVAIAPALPIMGKLSDNVPVSVVTDDA